MGMNNSDKMATFHPLKQFWIVILWLIWAVGLLAVYYRRLWQQPMQVLEITWLRREVLPVLLIVAGIGFLYFTIRLLNTGIKRLWRHRFKKIYQKHLCLGLASLIIWITLFAGYSLLVSKGFLTQTLPDAEAALLRFALNVSGATLILLAAQVLGIEICQTLLRWQPDDWREGLLYQMSIGLGAIAYLSLGLAGLRLYSATNIRILIAIVLLWGSLRFGQLLKHLGKQGIQGQIQAISTLTANFWATERVWKAIASLAVIIAFIGALAPEYEFDALSYHLSLPKIWLEQGYLVDLPARYVSLYPMTWGLIFGAGLALADSVAAKLLHFACLLFAALLTYQLTKRFVPESSGWLAIALFVTIPSVLWEATTAYNDIALAFHIGLVIYAVLRYAEKQSWQWLCLAALNLGLALATKHLALFVLMLVTIGLALGFWFQDKNLKRALVVAIAFGLLSLLLPLPWYIRSGLATGNPVFPELFTIFGAPPDRWDAVTEAGLDHFFSRFGRPHSLINTLTLPWDMTIHAARYGGNLGPLFLLLLPLLLLRRYSRSVLSIAVFTFCYILLWASPISSFQMRFLIPIAPLLAVLTAAAFEQLAFLFSILMNQSKPVLYAGMAALLSLNLPPFTSFHEGDRVKYNGWLIHVIRQVPISVVVGRESQEQFLSKMVPSYTAWRYINTYLPPGVRILSFSDGDYFYGERERIWSEATVARPAVWGATRGQEQQALQTLRQLGISHVLLDKQLLDSLEPNTLAIAQSTFLSQWSNLIYENDRYALYQLRSNL